MRVIGKYGTSTMTRKPNLSWTAGIKVLLVMTAIAAHQKAKNLARRWHAGIVMHLMMRMMVTSDGNVSVAMYQALGRN